MAHAYTPGLRVTGHTVIEKTRRLPLRGDVVASRGARVAAEDVVARTALPGNVHTVNVANLLGLPAADVPRCMLKQPGDPVTKDEPIAQAKSLFGLFKSTARANATGTIETVSEVTGKVTIREASIPVEVSGYVDGDVVEVMEGEGVVVRTVGALIQGIFGIGGERVGTLSLAVDDPGKIIGPEDLADIRDRIVVVGAHASHDLILKAKELGASAVVAGGISDADLKRLLGYDLGVAITGSEDIGITVIVTEGFGELPIAEKTFTLLRQLSGKKTSVNGATQIRAGVMRPEILVPLEAPGSAEEKPDALAGGLDIGTPIRIIRQPHFGRLGTVGELPPELRPLETEAKVRVLRVRFDDGSEAVIPRANVEMIES